MVGILAEALEGDPSKNLGKAIMDHEAETLDPRPELDPAMATTGQPDALDGRAPSAWPTVPGHEILGELGRGGMGVVYQARQIQLKRLVALKMIRDGALAGPQDVTRFRLEAEAVARLQHPNIVQIHEIGEYNGLPYFSLEFAEGGSLAARLDGRPLPPRQAAQIVEILGQAMQAAHQRGVIHRDLKPGNVLLVPSDSGHGIRLGNALKEPTVYELKVTDFGLAKKVEDSTNATATGVTMGTPSYMAPEQVESQKGAISPATDVYALGAILYELLTGRPPFRAATPFDTIMQVVSSEPVPPRQLQPTTPKDLETICLKCLQKEPGKRYLTAGALAEDLHCHLEDRPIVARPTGWGERGWRWCKRNRAVAASLLAVATVLVIGSVVSTWFGIQANFNAEEARKAAEAARLAEQRAHQSAEDAQREKGHADQAAEAARLAEKHATTQEAEARRLLYDARLNGARKSLDAGLVAEAQEELDRLRPRGPNEDDLRSFEWYHLYRKCLPADHLVLYGSGWNVNTIAWSGDGQLLASASGSGFTIRLWDGQSGEQVRVLRGHRGNVKQVCFSPDGTRLASAAEDDTVRVFQTKSGREMLVCDGHGKGARGVAWRPDSKQIASTDGEGKIHLWDGATGEPTGEFDTHAPIQGIRYSPDGKQLLTSADDTSARLWDASSGRLVRTFQGHTDQVVDAVFSPDGKTIATASADATARLWNRATGETRFVLFGHDGSVRGLAFNADDTRLATASEDRLVRLWDPQTAKLLQTFRGHGMEVLSVAFQPDGKRLASGSADQTARIWDLDVEPAKRARTGAGMIAFSPDSRMLGSQLFSQVNFIDLESQQASIALRGHSGEIARITFSADGRTIATLGVTDQTARLWDAATGKPLLTVRDKKAKKLFGLALDPLGRFLATGGDDGIVRLWDATPRPGGKEQVQPLRLLPLPRRQASWIIALAFSPDGRILASGGLSNELSLWDPETGKLLRECRGHQGNIFGIAFHPDGKELASGSWDGTVRTWEVATGQELRRLRMRQQVYPVVYSPDGKRLAAASGDFLRGFKTRESAPGELKLWDAHTGEELLADHHLPRQPVDLAFSPDGQRLAVSCMGALLEKDIRIFESTTTTGAAETAAWPVIYGNRFNGAGIGAEWKITTGSWSIDNGALRGQTGANGDADILLRGEELPDEVEVKYDVWTPHQLLSECRFLDRAGQRGFITSVRHARLDSPDAGVSFHAAVDEKSTRIGGTSGLSLHPGQHYHLRLLRRNKWLSLWVDGREVAMTVATDSQCPLLAFQVHAESPGQVVHFANLEIRAPTEAVRRRKLRSLTEELWDTHLLREPVRQRIKERKDLSAEESKWCLQVVDKFREDSERLQEAGWKTVAKPGAAPSDYVLALRQAEAACQVDPDNRGYVATLGLAQVRAGQFDKAIATLQRALEMTRNEIGAALPNQHGALALAFAGLGRMDEARDHLNRERDLMRSAYWANDLTHKEIVREAESLLGRATSAMQAEEEAIKDAVCQGEQAGWLRHDLAAFLAARTDDARSIICRGEQPDGHDVVLDRKQLQAVRRLQFSSKPPDGLHFSYENMRVRIQGDQAELRCLFTGQHEYGYFTYDVIYHLRRTARGWRIHQDRGWLVKRKNGTKVTTYDAETLKQLDANVEKLRGSGPSRDLVSALREAQRHVEAWTVARQLTEQGKGSAADWALRGDLAVEKGDAKDALQSFEKAIALDIKVELPYYMNREILTLYGHDGPVFGVAFRADGAQIVSSGNDRTVKIWDAHTGQVLRTLEGHEGRISGVAFSPDGRRIASGSADNSVRIWDAGSGLLIHKLVGHAGEIKRLAFSPDGGRVVSAGAEGVVKVWDVEQGKELLTLAGHEDQVLGAVFSPDGHRIASASQDGSARIWDAKTGKQLLMLRGHAGPVLRVAFSPDGKRLATAGADKTVKLWDAASGKFVQDLQGHTDLVETVTFSPDGLRLASAGGDGMVIVWDAATGRPLFSLRGQRGRIFVAAFSLDGKRLASCAADGTVKVWDVELRNMVP